MTDKEIAEEYAKIKSKNLRFCQNRLDGLGEVLFEEEDIEQAHLDGLIEGRKEGILSMLDKCEEFRHKANALEEDNLNKQELINDYVFENAKLTKENTRLSKMLEMAINEVLLCGKQMKVEHPSMIVWTEETFRAELEKRVENEK